MKFIDRIANRLGYYKPRSRSVLSNAGFSSGVMSRTTADWSTSELSADSEIQRFLQPIRARSRILCNNNDYARKFLWMLKTNVLGENGIMLKNMAKFPRSSEFPNGRIDKDANRIIEDNWWEWGQRENCFVTRDMSWREGQDVILETCCRDGAPLIQIIRGFKNRYAYALRLIECDYLDIELNKKLANGHKIRMGKEFNEWGECVAYWILKNNPNEVFFPNGWQHRYERIDARDIIHPFLRFRPEQTREIPWMMTAMLRLGMLAGYEEAELVASRLAAAKMGFWQTKGDQPYDGPDDGAGNKLMQAEPGAFEDAPEGRELQVVDWQHPNSQYAMFMKTALRGVAGGLGTSYNILADDMESVNFSSGRLGFQEAREVFKKLQCWFAETISNVIFSDWLEWQLSFNPRRPLAPLPEEKFDKFNAATWHGRRWPYIEPTKDVEAAIRRINSGLSSLTRELSDLGIDRNELFDEIKEDAEAVKGLGVTLPELFDQVSKLAMEEKKAKVAKENAEEKPAKEAA